MQRENYYIILELSVDPPENDPSVIEKAIQEKKAEWSRLRNHPTKGLQIQKFINMIPDIQKVMLDETLRAEEAEAAADFLEEGRESKISEVDSHIDILMGKGYIAKEDIIRLAEIHGLSQNEINDRINAKKNEKYAPVDQLIGLRMSKGYITEDELIKIAKKNSMDPGEIRNRVRCPIVKDEKAAEGISIRPMDKSIEKAINDNLKVVGGKSLYDFLGLSENAELKNLQASAAKKKKKLSEVGRKDAVVTAGATLAGHCLTIFKNDETRLAYDISLANAKLAALDSDINIAAINKKVRYEYFDALINKAMAYGMDRDEASAYIQTYCRNKKYRIEKKPKNKRLVLIATAVSVLLAVIIIAGIFVFLKIHHQNVIKSEYQQLVQKVNAQPDADEKIKLLKTYVGSHADSEYRNDAEERISKIREQVNSSQLKKILGQADALIQDQKLDEALALLKQSLETAKNRQAKKAIDPQIKKVSALIEKRDFEEITTVSIKGEPDQKIELYRKYLKNHPKGKHIEQVRTMINEIGSEYFIYVRKMLAYYEKNEKWEDCVRLCQSYINTYDNSNADLLKQLLPKYDENIRNEEIFQSLKGKADKLAPHYQAAVQIFKDYLEAYPESSITKKIKGEIKRLENLISIQNIQRATKALQSEFAATKGRYVEKYPEVILDTKTGLLWSMLDSDIVHPGQCLTYEQAKKYVASLTTGGFTDWRLPSPDELAGILKTSPMFPTNGKKAFWSSENYSGYSEGWQTQVTTLSSEDAVHWEEVQKNAVECGVVRAVRKP